MSRTIENRVVEMQFNNQQFEKAVAQSRQSIQLLEKDLKLVEGVEALKNINKAIEGVNFSSMASGIETLSSKFSTFGMIGMSAISTITSNVINGLLAAINSVGSALTNVGKQIWNRGMTRATNIEQANFSLEGILATQTKIKDASGKYVTDLDKVKEKTEKISKAIDASVSGTAYGYDEAAKIASTLVASYGSTDKGIKNVERALKTTVGLAGQTGREFNDVSRVMTKIAASGRAMSMDLMSIESWGLGAGAMIADYINADKKLTKQMNKTLSTRKKKRKELQKIDEADVRELASKSAISADLIMNVFEPFFENAQKANNTLSGINKNIGAALGRLGAAFIEPVIRNEGELVGFLQNVRQKLVDFLNVLKSVKLPDAITGAINDFLKVAGEAINKIDVKKTKDFFQSISNFFNAPWVKNIQSTAEMIGNAITTISSSFYDLKYFDDNYKTLSDYINEQFYGLEYDEIKKMLNSVEGIEELINDPFFNGKGIKQANGTIKADWGMAEYVKSLKIMKDNIISIGEARDLVFNKLKSSGKLDHIIGIDKIKNYEEFVKKYPTLANQINEEATKIYEERQKAYEEVKESIRNYLTTEEQGYDKLTEVIEKQANANERMKSVFKYPYMQELMISLQQVADAFKNVKDVISDVLHDVGSPLAEFYDILTGKSSLTIGQATFIRKTINSISEAIRNFSVKVRVFTTSDNFKSFVKGVVSIFEILRKTLGAAIQIAINAFHSFEPLFDRIFRLIGAIGEALGIVNESTDEFDVFATIVDVVSKAIDILANILTAAWDALMGFLSVFAVDDLNEYVEKFAGLIKIVSDYISENWPKWLEMVNPYLKKFADYAKKAGEWLKDKLGKAIEFVNPYFESFSDWVSNATDGFVDLKGAVDKISSFFDKATDKLKEFNPQMETAADIVNNTAEAINTLSDGFGGGTGGHFLGAAPKILGSILDFAQSKGGGIGPKSTEGAEELGDNLVNPFTVLLDKLHLIPSYISQIWEKITWEPKVKAKKGWEKIKEKLSEFVDWLKETDWDTIIEKFGKVLGIITGSFIGLNVGKSIGDYGTTIKNLSKEVPGVLKSFSTTIRSFSPFAAEVQKADNWTTRLNAIKDGLKAIAGIIIAFAATIAVLVGAVYVLGNMNPDAFWQGLKGLGLIMIPMLALFCVLIALVALMTGKRADTKTTSFEGLKGVKGISGLFQVFKTFGEGGLDMGTLSNTGKGQSTWKNLAAVAGIIVSFGASVLMLTKAVQMMGTINADQMWQGLIAFGIIAGAVLVLMAVVGLFAWLLRGKSSSSSSSKGLGQILAGSKEVGGNALALLGDAIPAMANISQDTTSSSSSTSGDWKVLAAMAGVIFLIGHSITEIMAALAIIANLPMNHLDKAIEAFITVVFGIGALLVIVGLIAALVTVAANQGSTKGKVITAALLSMAAVIFVIGHSITEIMTVLAIIANVPMNQLDKALDIFNEISFMIMGLVSMVGIIAIAIGLLSGSEIGGKGKVIVGTMITIAAVLAVFTICLNSIIGTIVELALLSTVLPAGSLESSLNMVESLMGYMMGIMAIAGIVGIVVGLMDENSATMAMAAIGTMALVIGAVAVVMIAVGKMVKDIAASGMDIDSVITILTMVETVIIIISGVIAVIAILTALAPEVMIPALLGIAVVFLSLAAVFAAIGNMAKLIGEGALLIAQAIKLVVDIFSNLNEKQVAKIGKNLEKFFLAIAKAVINGFINFVGLIMKNKAKIEKSLYDLISFIVEVGLAVIPGILQGALNTLGNILHIIADWFIEHTEDITTIIGAIGVIVYGALEDFFVFLLTLLFGEDGHGGLSHDLMISLFDFLDMLVNGNGGEFEGLIPWLGSLARQLGEKAVAEIGTILQIIRDNKDLPKDILTTITTLINSFATAIDEKGPELADSIGNLISSLIHFILYALGLDSNDGGMGKSVSYRKEPKTIASDFVKAMMPGFWLTKEGKERLSSFVQAVITYLKSEFATKALLMSGTGTLLASTLFKGFASRKGADINSPSKKAEKYAGYVVEGFTNVLSSKETDKKMQNSGIELAGSYFEGVNNGLSKGGKKYTPTFLEQITSKLSSTGSIISAELQGLFDGINIEIAPGLDLTKIREGAGTIQGMLDGSSSFSLDSINIDKISDIATKFDFANGISTPSDVNNSNEQQGSSVTFIQNNYSPEALNRIDIYRDTKNMLSSQLPGDIATQLPI